MSGHEPGCDLLLLECEPGDPGWLEFCVRQADRVVVLVSEGELRRARGELEWWERAKLSQRCCHLDLAIVHGRSDSLPRGADCAGFPGISRLHHVKGGSSKTPRGSSAGYSTAPWDWS